MAKKRDCCVVAADWLLPRHLKTGVALDAKRLVAIANQASDGAGGGGFELVEDGGRPVATLCGDPVCPPLPGEDASTEDMEAGRPVMDGGSEASADGSMADGAGPQQDASTDGSRSDSGGDGGSPDSEAAGD